MISGRNANSDGELYVLSSSGHRNVDRLSNSSYESNVRGNLNVSGDISARNLSASNLTLSGTLTAPNLNVKGSVTHSKSQMNAARAVCYSALTGQGNHSIIMVPLPSHNTNLDGECHRRINGGWHAAGVAKSNYFHQNCGGTPDNDWYGGGYTSFVSERYFERNRRRFTSCNRKNAFICCSPQFPN